MRPSGRATDQMRNVTFTRNFTKHAEGSVLVSFGDTRVICTATVEERIPRWMQKDGSGWVTAEYGMLPARPTAAWVVKLPVENRVGAPWKSSA